MYMLERAKFQRTGGWWRRSSTPGWGVITNYRLEEREGQISIRVWPRVGQLRCSGWPHTQECMDGTNRTWCFEKKRKKRRWRGMGREGKGEWIWEEWVGMKMIQIIENSQRPNKNVTWRCSLICKPYKGSFGLREWAKYVGCRTKLVSSFFHHFDYKRLHVKARGENVWQIRNTGQSY